MKKKLALMVVFASVFALCFALMGCGSDAESGAESTGATAEETAKEPAANVFPEEIYSGYVVDNDGRTSDIWWKDGQEGTEGIYITDAGNEAGKCVTWVDGDGKDVDSQFYCEVSPEGHLVSEEGKEPELDIVFNDDLTCYDYVTDTWYIRGDADQLTSELAGLTFATDDDSWTITFNPDGTFTDVVSNGDEATGTYKFISSCNILLTYDDAGIGEEKLDLEMKDGQVEALSNTWNHLSVVS
ncbi:MAG: hypothetical protein J5804_06750 [Eggerthellaceae bacterium]|nr:hypothetical protein [Eggerthellaceae bacterium]